MARKLSGYGPRKSLDPRLHTLSHARARCTVALRCRETHCRNRTHVNVSPALVSFHGSKTCCRTHRGRRRTARAAPRRMAKAGTVSQHGEFELSFTLEISIQNTRTAYRQSNAGDLHGVRSAAADPATA